MAKEVKFSLVFRDMWQAAGKYVPRVDQLMKVAPVIVKMGCFDRVETNGGGFEQVNLLYGENPNNAVRQWTKPFHEAGIQTHMLDRALNGLRMSPVPADVRKLFYVVKKKQGTDITRTFCGLNDTRNIIPSIKYAHDGGMISQCCLCITYSPIHTVEYYTKMAKELIDAGCDEICLKDMAGIGRPAFLGELTKNIKAIKDITIQYHSHAGPGFNMASILEVCKAGCDYVDVGMEPLSWGTGHADVIAVQAMLKDAGFKVKDINMKAYMEARALTQEFIEDFLGYFMDPTNKHMTSLVLKCGLPGGMMGSMMADMKTMMPVINMSLKAQGKPEMTIDEVVVKLFDEVEYVWPKVGYPPLVTPFSQYVKNIALMNIMAEAQGKPRYSLLTDKSIWGMILGKSGQLPGEVAPEIKELAKEQGLEFFTGDVQALYPDNMDDFRKEMKENGWETGPDDEELFELAMHPEQYRPFKSGVAKQRFEADLQKAKDARMAKQGFNPEDILKLKRAKAEPITAPVNGQVLWEIDVVNASMAPAIGDKFQEGDHFCYITTLWGEQAEVKANFTGKIIEVCAQQGATVNKGDVLAYIERHQE